MAECGRHVAAKGFYPAEVLPHESGGEAQIVLIADAFSLPQVSNRGRELVLVAVDDRPVGQHSLNPHMIACPAKRRQRPAVADECLIELAEELQDRAALRLSACALDAV